MNEIKIVRAKGVKKVSVTITMEDDGDGGVDFVDQEGCYLFGITQKGTLVLYEGVESDFFELDENGYIMVELG